MHSVPMSGPSWRIGLVQINNSFADACYLPYAVSLLQTYFQHHSEKADAFSFLLPIYRRVPVDDAVRHLAGADIVAISVSSWNFRVSLEIARRHKETHPQALIMLGGPHIPGNAEPLLRAYPWVDLICHGEGEIPFLRIFEAWPKRQWSDIPSISYLEGKRYINRPDESRVVDLDSVPSPYLAGTFDPLLREDRGHQWLALWETNRGCPFTCSYCDWGAATRSKLYCFGIERLKQEIVWFAEHRIEFIFCCDANFGILPRDLNIVKALAEGKKTSGYPQALSVQNTKDSDRSYEIQKALAEAGLSKGVNLAMQSMHPETLALIGRRNIPPNVFQNLQQRYNRDRIETFTDIIIGLPGETYPSFTSGVEKIIDNGQHNRIQFINLSILPNAPMAESSYRKMHGLISVESRIINIHGAPADYGDGIYETQELVVGNNTMPREDWRRARVFAWMASLLYFDKLLQIPMMLLKAEAGISYIKQIEAFIDLPSGKFPLLEELTRFFWDEAAGIQKGKPEFFHAPNWLGIYWPHDEYAYIRLSAEGKLDAFYREARQRMAELAASDGYPCPPWLSDAVRLNYTLLKQPFHRDDVTFSSEFELLGTCDEIRRTGSSRLMPGPASYVVNRTAERWQGWDDWSREVVWYGNKRGAYLYNFSRREQ